MYSADIAKRANKLLIEYDVKHPPVAVNEIAKHLCLKIIAEPLPEDISGVLDLRNSNEPIIMINSIQNPNRQRFSIGHEIGHFLLHKPLGIHIDKQSYFRSAKSSDALDEYETDANKFAAALLMPEEMIIKELDLHSSDWLDSDNDVIYSLAEKFAVSVTAMSYRLQNLGYLSR